MAYQHFLKEFALALGGDPATVDIEAEQVLDFEIELAHVCTVFNRFINIREHQFNLYGGVWGFCIL